MRVLAVAEHALQVQRGVHGGRKIRGDAAVVRESAQVAGDGAVVGSGVGKGFAAKLEAQLTRNLTLAFDLAQYAVIVLGIDHHGHALVVLGRRAHHGRAADVDVLDDLVEGGPARHGFAERVQIHHHKIDAIDLVLLHLLFVLGRGPA